MFKFLHAADIHLDSPLCGLERYDGAPVERIRGATRQALENLVSLAIRETVAFVVIAGDLYDGDWRDYNTGLFFGRQMTRLREAGIRVLIVAGNHDAASQLTRTLRMPENVKILATRAPETVLLNDIGVAIHGQGFPQRAVTSDLSERYPSRHNDYFNIGLLHTSVTGREGHETYAPCSVDALIAKGYQYWALGHVHQREILHESPWIVFSGNTQGRHIRETGSKGCTIVTVEDGLCETVEHRDLHIIRWALIDVAATGATDADEILDRARAAIKREIERGADEFLAVRLHLSGQCKAHSELSADIERWTNQMRLEISDTTGGAVWVEKVLFNTALQMDLDKLLTRKDPLGDLLRYIDSLESSESFFDLAKEDLSLFASKLPDELRRGQDAITIDAGDKMKLALEDVKQFLISRLLSSGAQQ